MQNAKNRGNYRRDYIPKSCITTEELRNFKENILVKGRSLLIKQNKIYNDIGHDEYIKYAEEKVGISPPDAKGGCFDVTMVW